MQTPRSFDIALIGTGMRGAGQLTREQLDVLERSRHIVLGPGYSEAFREFTRGFGAEKHDTDTLYYHEGADRRDVYGRIADLVIDLAQKDGDTSLLLYGHPLVACTPPQMIFRRAEKLGLDVSVFAGISSIDEILCLLRNVDPKDGLQILPTRPMPINPHLDLVLLMPEQLRDHTVRRERGASTESIAAYDEYRLHLLQYYPPEHPVRAFHVSSEIERDDYIIDATVDEFATLGGKLRYGHTLFIPKLPAARP